MQTVSCNTSRKSFVRNVNFFLPSCILERPLLKYYVARYIYKEVSLLQPKFGFLVRILHWCTHQSMDHALEKMELTAAQGHIMAYLVHAKEPPCPRDLEAEFQLTHPTVSGLLSRLEQKGFVELRTDPEDRRCKRIYVLPKGQQCHELMHQTIQKNEQRMTEGFTEEERRIFSDLLQRAIRNMGGDPTSKRFKEEDTQ